MNSLELMQLLARMAAKYRTTLSELEMDAYLDELEGFDEATLRAALQRCADDNPRFFPTAAEWRARARETMPEEDRDRENRLRYWKGVLPYGITPLHWTPDALEHACTLLGLPAPTRDAKARCAEQNRIWRQSMTDEQYAAWKQLPPSFLDGMLAALAAPQRARLGAA